MRLREYFVLLFFLIISQCCALSCRSEHTSKQNELKKVFNNCLKQMEGNSSESSRNSEDRANHNNKRNQWQRDYQNENDRNKNEDGDRSRDNGNRDRNREYGNRHSDRDRDDSNERSDNRQNKNDMRDNQYNRMDSRQNKMGSRNDRTGSTNGVDVSHRGSNGMMNSYSRNDHLSGQDEFLQSEEYGRDTSHHNSYYYPSPPSQSSRRYKREKRVEMNSGQRSQYNPHSQRSSGREDSYKNERNSSDNSSREANRACVLHCFLENLHMTGDNGMPDRYLVTHSLIKDEKDEDLRDFMQESIEECFQILDSENTEDKCEFSKNLLTCLAERGRANCDDWTGKTSFLFE